MRPEEDRSFEEKRVIDIEDGEALEAEARRYSLTPQEIAEAVRQVGPNRTAVEIFLGEARI